MAKYYELTENDVVGTVLTDSAVDVSVSRIEELNEMHGAYNVEEAKLWTTTSTCSASRPTT